MNIVCEVCGDIGYKHLLLRCRECNSYAVHQYCLEKVIYDASLIEWFCYECVQRRGEVTCTRSVEKVSSESPLSHAHFGSPVRQITKRVKLSRNAGPWRNRKNESSVTKYVSLNKRFSSIKKHTKKKSITKPMGNCTNKEGQIDKVTTHTSAEASCSCESIGTESAKGNHGRNQQVDQENPVAFNTGQPCPLVMNSLGTLSNTEQSHLLETTEGLAYKLKKVPQSFTAPLKGLEKRENVVLGSSCSTSDLGNCALGESGDKLNGPNDSGANLSSKHTDHVNQHTSVGCKNMEGKSVKDKKPVDAHKNMFWPVDSLRNSQDKYEAHGDSNKDIENGFTPERDKEEVRLQPDHCASNELLKINMATNLTQLPTLQNDAVDTVMPYSPNGGYEELFSCPGKKNVRSVRERSVDPINISSISQHDTIKASETSGRSTECQKASSCHRGETVKMAKASSSSDKSGEHILSGNVSLEYVLGYRSYLSKAQKKRVRELIQEIQPEFTIFISIMRKSNVQPPGPYLGITKDYAIAHFPDETTNVTLEMPGNSKKWHPKFYKRDESRKTMLMGQWLDFIRDNHVQEGDICLILPTKDERRCTFMVYVIHETKTNSRDGAGFQRVGPCPGVSSVTMASEIHIEEESTAGEHVPFESDMQEIPHERPESVDSDDAFDPPYFVPCKSTLSKSQKRIVEERVRAIRSEVPICVAVMKNNNVGVAQRWMLELGSRYGSIYLPTKGQTILLQCRGKTWEAKMMFHNGRRWFLNGGWPNFARGNGLRVGDICLFELKKRESKLTMAVHIIPKEKF